MTVTNGRTCTHLGVDTNGKIILMEKTSLTFTPVLWRLVLHRCFFVFVGWTIAIIFNALLYFPLDTAIFYILRWILLFGFFVTLLGTIIVIILTIKRYDVVISNGKISGPGGGTILNRNVFLISDLERSSLDKASFMDKLSGRRVLCSTRGEKIAFIPFIYGNASYDILCQHLEKEYNS